MSRLLVSTLFVISAAIFCGKLAAETISPSAAQAILTQLTAENAAVGTKKQVEVTLRDGTKITVEAELKNGSLVLTPVVAAGQVAAQIPLSMTITFTPGTSQISQIQAINRDGGTIALAIASGQVQETRTFANGSPAVTVTYSVAVADTITEISTPMQIAQLTSPSSSSTNALIRGGGNAGTPPPVAGGGGALDSGAARTGGSKTVSRQ